MVGARRFVDNLLRQRRGGWLQRRLRIDPSSDAELRTAILLRSARVGADSVHEEFVSSLHQRLAEEMDEPPAPAPLARRQVIVRLGVTAAASAAVGAGLDQVLTSNHQAPAPTPPEPVIAAPPELAPDNGVWMTVATTEDLPEGSSIRFDLGTITGFVTRTNTQVRAVSGICTHLGCKLNLDAPAKMLNCPCHGASFSVTGAVLEHRLKFALQPLPLIQAREVGGAIQVFAPPPNG
ncbi:MAG TPA: Rieske 2Fe-2S domain-containing protein [Pseudonocardiaceae bacterium]|nr:Rieske 2Fe-2S domain-containing protein [Pseudonocardiaceae bacterium]